MILTIPDSHNYHGDNKKRFDLLGQHIEATKPETIVIMGDWFDMHSINRFDKEGSLAKEGERLHLDIQAGISSLFATFHYYTVGNVKRKAAKQKQYKPRIVFIEGNHENRMDRFVNENPVLENLPGLNIKNMITHPKNSPKMEWVDYGKAIEIDNILFTHILFNGGRPISGKINTCGDAIKLVDKSVVFCHTHRLEWKQFIRLGSNKLITALNGGCFIEQPWPKYMEASNPNWWSGVCQLYPDGKGNFDLLTVSLEQLKRVYA